MHDVARKSWAGDCSPNSLRGCEESILPKVNDRFGWRSANEGRAAARKRGVHMGRKPKLIELQWRVARERVAKGESARAIAREWSVAHTALVRPVA